MLTSLHLSAEAFVSTMSAFFRMVARGMPADSLPVLWTKRWRDPGVLESSASIVDEFRYEGVASTEPPPNGTTPNGRGACQE
jgi:hypothetical protein